MQASQVAYEVQKSFANKLFSNKVGHLLHMTQFVEGAAAVTRKKVEELHKHGSCCRYSSHEGRAAVSLTKAQLHLQGLEATSTKEDQLLLQIWSSYNDKTKYFLQW